MNDSVRQLSREEILPDNLNIAEVTINRAMAFCGAPEFYGKPRAYFFTNFVIITLGLCICTVRSLLFEDIEPPDMWLVRKARHRGQSLLIYETS